MTDRPVSIATTSAVALSSFTDLRRRATDPAGGDLDLDPAFDADTLFYDVLRASDDEIVALGPPLLDLAERLDLAFGLPVVERRSLDRHQQVWLAGRAPTVEVRSSEGDVAVTVADAGHDLFAGRRVLLTLSRDNPIEWILDWARFHRDAHGADAVLLYDNGSRAYAVEDLAAALEQLAGFRTALVVHWPFPYGPDLRPRFPHSYCQLGVLEHARWRYLQRARSVLNGDIDELVLAPWPGIHRLAEASPFGALRYRGRWIHDVEPEDGSPRSAGPARHRDLTTILRRSWEVGRWHGLPWPVVADRTAAKWTVVPRRVPRRVQWRVHDLAPWTSLRAAAPGVSLRHFRPISTNWKYDRTKVGPYDPEVHRHDRRLARALAGVEWDR